MVINISDIGDPYEKPINIELDEIIVYQEGRRVTLETDEHAQLLREARFSGKLNLITLLFLSVRGQTNITSFSSHLIVYYNR